MAKFRKWLDPSKGVNSFVVVTTDDTTAELTIHDCSRGIELEFYRTEAKGRWNRTGTKKARIKLEILKEALARIEKEIELWEAEGPKKR